MSPITHGMIGWLCAQPLEGRKDRNIVTAAALLPDIDGIGAVFGMEYYLKYHHTFGHSLILGISLIGLGFAFGVDKKRVPLLIFLSFHLHMLCDLLGSGSGWGIYYLWPFTNTMYQFPSPFQWELDDWRNILTTFICLVWILWIGIKKGRTIVELVSLKLDGEVVKVLRKWTSR